MTRMVKQIMLAAMVALTLSVIGLYLLYGEGLSTHEWNGTMLSPFKPAGHMIPNQNLSWAMEIAKLIYIPQFRDRRVREVGCRMIFDGDKEEVKKAKHIMSVHPKKAIPDEAYIHLTANCSEFIKQRGYYMKPSSKEEANYPIAHSILLYQEAEQAERLLRAIYQPQNLYCIHVDLNSPRVLYKAMEGIAKCFPNVFMASKQVPVVYATYLQLEADINCMKDLDKSKVKWKYFLNHASSAFPMRTNAELVKILKIFNGTNDIEKLNAPHLKDRWEVFRKLTYRLGEKKASLKNLMKPHGPAPYNINITKGSAQGAFSREMVRFIVNDPKAKALFEWSKNTYSPEEHYWSTLNDLRNNPGLNTPGGSKGRKKYWLARLSIWYGNCEGELRHSICMFSVGDLHKHKLHKRPELFANKFYLTKFYLALDCMEELIHNRTVKPKPFNTTYYKNLPFVKPQ